MRTCPWCNGKYDLVMQNGRLSCPECHFYIVNKDEPGWEASFASHIGVDEYWMRMDDNPLKVIQ